MLARTADQVELQMFGFFKKITVNPSPLSTMNNITAAFSGSFCAYADGETHRWKRLWDAFLPLQSLCAPVLRQ